MLQNRYRYINQVERETKKNKTFIIKHIHGIFQMDLNNKLTQTIGFSDS